MTTITFAGQDLTFIDQSPEPLPAEPPSYLRLPYTAERFEALRDVRAGRVRFHNGLSGPALGYTWAAESGGQMMQDRRETLRELWAADFIDVVTHRIFCDRGHEVRITHAGAHALDLWIEEVRK